MPREAEEQSLLCGDGAEGGGPILLQHGLPGSTVTQDGPLVHRTSPSSTYTWHMGSAASEAGLASNSGWYGQPVLDGSTGASLSSSCSNRGRPTAPCSPSPKAKYCPQWLRERGVGQRPISPWP